MSEYASESSRGWIRGDYIAIVNTSLIHRTNLMLYSLTTFNLRDKLNIVFKVKDGPLIGEINSEAQPNC